MIRAYVVQKLNKQALHVCELLHNFFTKYECHRERTRNDIKQNQNNLEQFSKFREKERRLQVRENI